MMSFDEKVWQLCKKIPRGKVTTYGEIAKALGTKGYQAVGMALNRNKNSFLSGSKTKIPGHRVVMSDGRVGGFAHGTSAKIKLLQEEGIVVKNKQVQLDDYLFRLDQLRKVRIKI